MSEKTKATNEEKRQLAAELAEANAATTRPEPDTPPQEPQEPPKKRARRKTQPAEPQPADVIEEPHPDNTAGDRGIILLCDHCGAELLPDKDGMYPEFCPNCKSENDYRGIGFLERSADILVCDRCGHLTKLNPGVNACHWCGAGGA